MRVHPVQSVPEGIEGVKGGGVQGMASNLEGFAGLPGLVPELADDLSRQVHVPSVGRGASPGLRHGSPLQPLDRTIRSMRTTTRVSPPERRQSRRCQPWRWSGFSRRGSCYV